MRYSIIQPDGIVVLKCIRNQSHEIRDYEYVLVNQNASKLLGKPAEELIGSRISSAFPGALDNGSIELYNQVVETGEPVQFEKFYEGNGFANWYFNQVAKIEDGVTITFNDITEKKNAKEELENKNHLLEKILNGTSDAFVVLKPLKNVFNQIYDFKYLSANNATELMLNRTREEIIGKTVLELFPNVEANGILNLYKLVAETGTPFENEFFYEHDGKRYFYQKGVKIGSDILIITSDVTKTKVVEDALNESKNFAEAIAFNSPHLIFLYNLKEKKIAYINNQAETILGYSPHHIQNFNNKIVSLIHPTDLRGLGYPEFICNQEQGVTTREFRVKEVSGKWVWMRAHMSIFSRDEFNKPLLIIGTAERIQEQKEDEQEKQKLKALFENIPTLVGFSDLQGKIEYINPAGMELIGLTSIEECKEKSLLDFFVQEDTNYLEKIIFPWVYRYNNWKGKIHFRNFKTGEKIAMSISIFLVNDQKTQPLGIAFVTNT